MRLQHVDCARLSVGERFMLVAQYLDERYATEVEVVRLGQCPDGALECIICKMTDARRIQILEARLREIDDEGGTMNAREYAQALIASVKAEREAWLEKPEAWAFDYGRVMSGEIRSDELERARAAIRCEPPHGFPSDEAILEFKDPNMSWERAALHQLEDLIIGSVIESDPLVAALERVCALEARLRELDDEIHELRCEVQGRAFDG